MYTINIYNSFAIKGACDCDLNKDYCDLICCCDADCKQQDKNAFNCKNETYTRRLLFLIDDYLNYYFCFKK